MWSGCFRGRPPPPTAAYVVSANVAPFSDPGLVLGGILTLLPRHSPVLLLCARSSSHRLRLGIRPLERSRWILGPETIFRTFSVDCRTASRTAARACVRDPAGALGREGQSAAWSPGPASMAALRAGHLAEGARLRFRHYSGPRMSPLANVHEAAHPIRCVALGRHGHQAIQAGPNAVEAVKACVSVNGILVQHHGIAVHLEKAAAFAASLDACVRRRLRFSTMRSRS